MPAVTHRVLRRHGGLGSMISMRCWDQFGLLVPRFCNHVVMTRMMIIARRLVMIMLGGVSRGFGQGIADVLRNRLARAVTSAVAHPTGQVCN